MSVTVPDMDGEERQAWSQWHAATADPELDAAIGSLYDELDAAVAAHQPVCDASGRCCRFESYGHRLYVTALEATRFLRRVHEPKDPEAQAESERPIDVDSPRGVIALPQLALAAGAGIPEPEVPDACPYQRRGLCSVHALRPLGCRVYFCQPGTSGWQSDLTEVYLERIKTLHEARDLPYRYAEWRALISAAQSTRPGSRLR